jgi:hypothetical protein
MFKKGLCLLALTLLLAVPLAGTCSADDGTGDRIECVKDYPGFGFRAHSWVAGDVAYTQIIDLKSGEVLKKVETKIVSPEPVF